MPEEKTETLSPELKKTPLLKDHTHNRTQYKKGDTLGDLNPPPSPQTIAFMKKNKII